MGKSTIKSINAHIFNSFLYVYQAGYIVDSHAAPAVAAVVVWMFFCCEVGFEGSDNEWKDEYKSLA